MSQLSLTHPREPLRIVEPSGSGADHFLPRGNPGRKQRRQQRIAVNALRACTNTIGAP
jgi:hypothetical protein